MSTVHRPTVADAIKHLATEQDFVHEYLQAAAGYASFQIELALACKLGLMHWAAKNPKRTTKVETAYLSKIVAAQFGPHRADYLVSVSFQNGSMRAMVWNAKHLDREVSCSRRYKDHRLELVYKDRVEVGFWVMGLLDNEPHKNITKYVEAIESFEKAINAHKDWLLRAQSPARLDELHSQYTEIAAALDKIHDNPLNRVFDSVFNDRYNPLHPF
jgi:hypothetical protein